MQEYRYKPYEPGIKEQVMEMAISGSGIHDTAQVLNINKNTVISTLKKADSIVQVNPNFQCPKSRERLGSEAGRGL